ncbi:MAG: pyridoxamine 5'-phosphate oxidase family protein [Mogibacterium sp.]|nr:pyridoxamine 5'-phosphate oxidase family protein [Mogibacterium sp.]
MERVTDFLKQANTYYLATTEGDQARVRPFGTAHIFEGRLYIQTGASKDVFKQIMADPKVEICAFLNGEWIRVCGELVDDNRCEPKASMLDAYPDLKKLYSAEDDNTRVLYFRNAKATFCSFTSEPETVEF